MDGKGHWRGRSREKARDGARKAEHQAERLTRSPLARGVARAGFLSSGLLHGLIAWLAAEVALGGNRHADQTGAVEQLASAPGGPALLWGGAVCCAALAAWMVLEFAAEWRRHGTPARGLGPFGTGVAYVSLAGLFVSFAMGNRANSSEQSKEITAALLAAPFGAVVLVAAGLALLGAGGYFGFRGVTRSFLGKDAQPTPLVPAWVKVVGCVGFVAKGVALAVVGVLVLVALAVVGVLVLVATARHDASQQSGLDGALKGLAAQPFGGWILGAVAVGLACYGVYSAARARYADF